jgi:hypothetical protein
MIFTRFVEKDRGFENPEGMVEGYGRVGVRVQMLLPPTNPYPSRGLGGLGATGGVDDESFWASEVKPNGPRSSHSRSLKLLLSSIWSLVPVFTHPPSLMHVLCRYNTNNKEGFL